MGFQQQFLPLLVAADKSENLPSLRESIWLCGMASLVLMKKTT